MWENDEIKRWVKNEGLKTTKSFDSGHLAIKEIKRT